MKNLAENKYSHDEIIKILKGNRKVKYRYELLDKNLLYLGDLTASGYIDFNANADITRVANLKINEIKDINYIDERIKIYFSLSTPRGWIDYPLGVFLVSSPNRYSNGLKITRDSECYDYGVILQEDKFTARYLVKAGATYTDEILKILNSAGIVNVNIQQSDLTTNSDIEFKLGLSKLDAVNTLLKSINYNNLYFDEYGNACVVPYILPVLRNIDEVYETDGESIIKPGATEILDTFNVPNKIIRYTENPDYGELISTYVNDNPTSKFSVQSRGRIIVDVDSVSDVANQAVLDAYVQRVAVEKSVYQSLSFRTANMPHHGYLDCLMINNKDLDVQGKYIELGWRMNLETGGEMTHSVRRVVPI